MRAGLLLPQQGKVHVSGRTNVKLFANNLLQPVPAASRPHSFQNARSTTLPRNAVVASRPSRRGAVKTMAFFNIFKSDPAEATRKKYQSRVDEINALEPKMQALSDEQLREKTEEFKRRVQGGESLDKLLVEAFAVSGRVAWEACMWLCMRARPRSCPISIAAQVPARMLQNDITRMHAPYVQPWGIKRGAQASSLA